MNRKAEYRNLGKVSVDEEKRVIEGLIPYNSRSEDMGFFEYIAPTAFNKTLADKADVRALWNHDTTKLLGRVSNGSLQLESREDGLHCVCTLPDTSYAEDVYKLIRDGYNPGMSFGFNIINQDEKVEEGREIHTLREVRLFEVSFGVSFPAYEETKANARCVRGIDLDDLAEAIEKEDKNKVSEYIGKLRKLATEETTTADKVTVDEPQKPSLAYTELMRTLDIIGV